LPIQTQTPAIATAAKARQVSAWRIGNPNEKVNRRETGLSRVAVPAKATCLKQGLLLRWTNLPGWGQVLQVEFQVNARHWIARADLPDKTPPY